MAVRVRCVCLHERSAERSAHMSSPCLDIFRKDAHGNPVWITTVPDLDDARHQLSELAQTLPGVYFVFDHATHSVVYQQSQPDFTCT